MAIRSRTLFLLAVAALSVPTAVATAALAQTSVTDQPAEPSTTVAPLDPTSTTLPSTSTTVPGAPAPDGSTTTTTTVPATVSSTVAPTTTTTTRTDPGSAADHHTDTVLQPTPADSAAARQAFLALTADQRSLLDRLQERRDDLARARLELAVLAAQATAAQARVDDADAAALDAARTAKAAAARLRTLRSDVRDMARSVYQVVDRGIAFDAVNTDDHIELGRAQVYAGAPERTLDALVSEARATKQRLDDAARQALAAQSAARTARDAARAATAKQQDALSAAEDAAVADGDAVSDALGSGVALLAQVADPRFGPDAITAALAVAQAGEPDPATLLGAFRLPVSGAPLGSPYGTRVDPITGELGYHPGIDFEAPAGAEVHAPADGTVVVAGDCGGYGNCVVVDHGHSLATVDAHLERVLVAVGQPVVEGQVLGLVGSTGRSTGPHLHFEVRVHGVPVDPLLALSP